MSIVFIGSPHETFTPTRSGALATIMHGHCMMAKQEGIEPWVIARQCPAPSFDWKNLILLPGVEVPTSGPGWWMARLERKILGWSHPGQRQHSMQIAQAIAQNNLRDLPFVICNNVETAILLRRKFPQARIYHWFQNQLEVKDRARGQLAGVLDGAFAVSDFTNRWIVDYYQFPAEKVVTLYNCVDAKIFANTPREIREKPVLNFVGRTGREKAPDLLLKAALLLARHTKNFRIQIVGSNHWGRFEMDDYQKELKALSRQLEENGIEVTWTGHVGRERLPEVLRQADINVVPSRWDEPFGLVTLEGMSCGLATVASNTGGTPEVCGDAALLFERDNVRQLAAHLQKLMEDKALREDYARRGRQRAELFTWERAWRAMSERVLRA